MRMWMIDPKLMCKDHLLGEHNEIHKAVGNLKHSGIWANNLIRTGYLEPQNFKQRHDKIVKEMLRRGYQHNSPLQLNGVKLLNGKVDIDKSFSDLINRCGSCRKNIVSEFKDGIANKEGE